MRWTETLSVRILQRKVRERHDPIKGNVLCIAEEMEYFFPFDDATTTRMQRFEQYLREL